MNNTIDNFKGYGISPIDHFSGLIAGRKFGGVGFMWHKDLEGINIITFEEQWILGLKIENDEYKILILNV